MSQTSSRSFKVFTSKSRTGSGNSIRDNHQKMSKSLNHMRRMFQSFERNKSPVNINNIKFQLYSWEDLKKLSTITISNVSSTIGSSITYTPDSSLLGTSSSHSVCKTCHADIDTCPGHLGLIEFKEPIVHPSRAFAKDILNILKSICTGCGKLVLLKEEILELIEKSPANESKKLANIAEKSEKIIGCPEDEKCERYSNFSMSSKNYIYNFHYNGDLKTNISARTIFEIFDQISDEDASLLGFRAPAHPRNLILWGIPVIPPCARPPAFLDDGSVRINIFTELYNKIVTTNNAIDPNNPETTDLSIAVYNLTSRGNGDQGDVISLKTKITDKNNGIIRSINQGKTIANSGRGVIVCDPTLQFGEIGIPSIIAQRMTISIKISEDNISLMTKYLKEGKVKSYFPSDKESSGFELIINDNNRMKIELNIGDIIERELMDGDSVISFRQPVLYKLSILAGRVKLRDDDTFAIHMAETTARNADFDGDEINIHTLVNKEYMNLASNFMSSRRMIMDAQNNMIIMGVVYDGLIAIYHMMLEDDKIFSRQEFTAYLSIIKNRKDLPTLAKRAKNLGVENLFTFKMLFSALLPEGLFYKKHDVVILNGILLKGRVGKNNVGIATDTIIQQIIIDFGDQRAADFITDIYNLLVRYLSDRGFSVGYKDIVISEEMIKHTEEELTTMSSLIQLLYTDDSSEIEKQYREKKIQNIIASYTERLYKQNKDTASKDNRLIEMIDSGAKGKHVEFGGMTLFVGQKYSRGQRIKKQITNFKRSSIYFDINDKSAESQGFIINSYRKGLTPAELIFSQTGARDDIVMMMMGTPDTGSLSHQITRSLENAKTFYDGTVINPNGKIVQYSYADNFEAERMIAVSTPQGHVNTFCNVDRIIERLNMKYGNIIDDSQIGEHQESEYVEMIEIKMEEPNYEMDFE